MKVKKLMALALGLAVSLGVSAQHVPTLEEAVYGGLIHTQYGGHVNWLKDGAHFSKIEKNDDGRFEVYAYDAKNNKREVLIPADLLVNPETGRQIPVSSFQFTEDNSKVMIFTNTRRVWRYNTRGDYWVADLKTGTVRRLGTQFPEASLMYAKFSPDGKMAGYVSGNNIYTEDIDSGKVTAITTDGSDKIVNGNFDWVYEEEFKCLDGWRWSPDSKYIAYWQSDTEGTGWFEIMNNVDSLYPKIWRFPYPKAGTTNSAVRVGFAPADGGATKWIDIPGDARNNYIPRMDFIPGTNELYIQQMNRAQNTDRLWFVTIPSTEPQNLFTDKDAAWVDANDNIQWLKNNKFFTWESDRDGYRHIYVVRRDGSDVRCVTPGDFDIASYVGIDQKRGLVYFIASPENYTQRYLYSARLFGKPRVKLISPVDEKGQHKYNMSPSGEFAVHTFSNSVTPPVIDMVRMPAHKQLRLITDNAEAKAQWEALGLEGKEFVKVRSGELMLDAWMIKPADFDPAKKYPVIMKVYGEPANSTVQDRWEGGNLWEQYMANQGYIMVSVENRGAKVPRGREWRKCIYGEIGTFASQDQARGIQDMCRQFDYLDASRIGITGWSGGGSQTLNCMFRYPKVFSTGIAVAPVADERLYDTVYQERYMNTPQNNPEGYRKGSPITYAAGLEGNLLIIHGTGDDNVHYQGTEMLVNELVKHGKIFYQISYPMRSHGIYEREGTSLHLRKTWADFWLKNLPAGGR